MIACPNCKKELKDNFKFCNACGSPLDGGIAGDYSTEVKNVFTHESGFVYLFFKNGIQIVVRGKTLEDLKRKVVGMDYPWILQNGEEIIEKVEKSTGSMPHHDSLFLTFSRQAENKVIKTDSYYAETDLKEVLEKINLRKEEARRKMALKPVVRNDDAESEEVSEAVQEIVDSMTASSKAYRRDDSQSQEGSDDSYRINLMPSQKKSSRKHNYGEIRTSKTNVGASRVMENKNL